MRTHTINGTIGKLGIAVFALVIFLSSCATADNSAQLEAERERDEALAKRDLALAQNAELERALEQQGRDLALARNALGEAEKSLGALKADIEQLQAQRNNLSAENSNRFLELSRQLSLIETLQAERQDIINELNRVKELNARLQDDLSKSRAETVYERNRVSASSQDFERKLNEQGQLAVQLGQRLRQLEQDLLAAQNAFSQERSGREGLQQELSRLTRLVDEAQRALGSSSEQLRRELSTKDAEISDLRRQLAEAQRASRALAANLATETARVQTAADQLRSSLAREIEAGDIEIRQVENVIVVSVRESIIFAPDRAELNPRYENVLQRMAAIFNTLPEKIIRIEGHTAVAISSPETLRRYPTSWDLGAARAISVLRFFQERSGIDPLRLVAATLGEYRPIASNASETTRQANRRVEIVLLNRPLYETRAGLNLSAGK